MINDPAHEMFFIKKGETQCKHCEAHFPKNISSHSCANLAKDVPQIDYYFLDSGKMIRRAIFFKSRTIYFMQYVDKTLEIYAEFKIVTALEILEYLKGNKEKQRGEFTIIVS